MSIDPKFVSTGFEFPGYRVAKTLGVVRGVVVVLEALSAPSAPACRHYWAATSLFIPRCASAPAPTPTN